MHLGDSAEKILDLYGFANYDNEVKNTRVLMYEDSFQEWNEVLFYSAVFEFIHNKLARVSIYNGD